MQPLILVPIVLQVWNNIFMPNGLTIGPDNNIYIGELPGMIDADPIPPNHGQLLAHQVKNWLE